MKRISRIAAVYFSPTGTTKKNHGNDRRRMFPPHAASLEST